MPFINPDEEIRADHFINESERSLDPADDAGKVAKLEDSGELSDNFIPASEEIIEFTADGIFDPTAYSDKYNYMEVLLIGAGGNGGGINSQTTTSSREVVASGGGGGEVKWFVLYLPRYTETINITVAQKPAQQSASVSGSETNTIDGFNGDDTIFGNIATAQGGRGGSHAIDTDRAIVSGGIGGSTTAPTRGSFLIHEAGGNGGDGDTNQNAAYHDGDDGGTGGGGASRGGTGGVSTLGFGNGGDGAHGSYTNGADIYADDGTFEGGGGGGVSRFYLGTDDMTVFVGRGAAGFVRIRLFR